MIFFERLMKHEDESNMVYRILAVCWFVCVQLVINMLFFIT